MTLTRETRKTLEAMRADETFNPTLTTHCMDEIASMMAGYGYTVPNDDRAAELEAAVYRYVAASAPPPAPAKTPPNWEIGSAGSVK